MVNPFFVQIEKDESNHYRIGKRKTLINIDAMNQKSYTCPKCGGRNADLDEIRTTGSGFTKYFNIQNRKFTAVICTRCGFTEFYRGGSSSKASNVLDFLTN